MGMFTACSTTCPSSPPKHSWRAPCLLEAHSHHEAWWQGCKVPSHRASHHPLHGMGLGDFSCSCEEQAALSCPEWRMSEYRRNMSIEQDHLSPQHKQQKRALPVTEYLVDDLAMGLVMAGNMVLPVPH